MEHSIEDGYADGRFGLLAAEASCSQTPNTFSPVLSINK
jgi:hypothetical protein